MTCEGDFPAWPRFCPHGRGAMEDGQNILSWRICVTGASWRSASQHLIKGLLDAQRIAGKPIRDCRSNRQPDRQQAESGGISRSANGTQRRCQLVFEPPPAEEILI